MTPPTRPEPDPIELLELATTLAHAAGELTLAMRTEARLDPDTKSSSSDLVTKADRAAETLIVEGILAARPDDAIVGEEGADTPGTSGVRWLIDPIDGTTNYVYDLPGYSVSIAALWLDTTIAGVVHDPKAHEVFSASIGNGATMNGEALSCSIRTDLQRCVVGTGFGYRPDQRRVQAEICVHMLPLLGNIRRLGSAALDLAYVGAGRIDGYWESGLNPWDSAAGALIATEAGARVTDLAGNAASSEMTLAASPALHSQLQRELRLAMSNLAV